MRALRIKRRTGWFSWLCAVCIIFAVFGGAAEIQAAGTGTIYGSTANAEKDGEVTVSFAISGNPGIWGLKGTVSYDSSAMTLKSVSAGGVFSASEMLLPEDLGQSPFTFLATGSAISNKTGNGVILYMTFKIHSDAKLGDYGVNISINQAIDVDEQDVAVNASGAKIKVVSCVHRNTYLKNEVKATETAEGYSGDTYCKKCNVLLKKGTVTPIVINTCEHNVTSWTVTQEPACEVAGKKEHTCQVCGTVLEEEELPATGHNEAALTGWKAATTTEEGYTGDIYCEICNKLIQQGEVTPKIKIQVFSMTSPQEDTYFKESQTGLVFISDADIETFVRVELNGQTLHEQCYTLESGSTKVTLSPQYLETLTDGRYTITIVSDAGTASAQFRIAERAAFQIENRVLLIITLVAVVVAVGCVTYTVISGARRNRKGRYSTNHEK